MENSTLTKPLQPRCADLPSTIDSLISEWVVKLAINAGAALDAKTQAVYCSLWLEGLSDLSSGVLQAAFRKTLRECAYWPVKVADIRKHVSHAESNATTEAVEKAWERVLEIRRVHWNPDVPGPFHRALAALPERIRQAARASGVFRDHESQEALHVWAKKKFSASFTAYGEREQDAFLVSDGEIKKLLTDFSENQALPAPDVCFNDLHRRGVEYGKELRVLYEWKNTADSLPEWDADTRQQIEQELAGYRERFNAALARKTATPWAEDAANKIPLAFDSGGIWPLPPEKFAQVREHVRSILGRAMED
jgi:hypothetical protein